MLPTFNSTAQEIKRFCPALRVGDHVHTGALLRSHHGPVSAETPLNDIDMLQGAIHVLQNTIQSIKIFFNTGIDTGSIGCQILFDNFTCGALVQPCMRALQCTNSPLCIPQGCPELGRFEGRNFVALADSWVTRVTENPTEWEVSILRQYIIALENALSGKFMIESVPILSNSSTCWKRAGQKLATWIQKRPPGQTRQITFL